MLLQRGAARVIALDVGYGQLHPRLRADARSRCSSGRTPRMLTSCRSRRELVVCDVSFISVRIVLPPVLRLCAPGWEAVVLVKPQFEAGRADVGKGGVVRDDACGAGPPRGRRGGAVLGGERRGVVDSGSPARRGTGSSSSTSRTERPDASR